MTVEKASDRLGRMTFNAMAIAKGIISLIATLLGVNMSNRGLERVKRVSHVTKKWKAANVSWESLRVGSEKMALLVKTCGDECQYASVRQKVVRELTIPIVASVLTTIHMMAVLVELSFFAGAGLSTCSSGNSSALSTSSPASTSSSAFILTKLAFDEVIFSFSSKCSASVTEEVLDATRSAVRSAIVRAEEENNSGKGGCSRLGVSVVRVSQILGWRASFGVEMVVVEGVN